MERQSCFAALAATRRSLWTIGLIMSERVYAHQLPRLFSNTELQQTKLWAAQGLSAQQIANELGRSRDSIAGFCRRNNIKLSAGSDFRHMSRSEQFTAILRGWELARAKILAEIETYSAPWLPNGPSKAVAEAIQKRIEAIPLPISEDTIFPT